MFNKNRLITVALAVVVIAGLNRTDKGRDLMHGTGSGLLGLGFAGL